MTEKKRLFRGLIEWLGFRTKIIEFSAPERAFGRDSFSFNSLLSLAVTTLMSFSMWPLKIIGVVGFIFSFGSALAGVIMLGLLVVNGFSFIRPLAFVIVANVFLTGLVLCSLGLVGWYIGVIHSEVIGRPLYVIRTRLGISKSDTMSRLEHETTG